MAETQTQAHATLEAMAQLEVRLIDRMGQLEVRMLERMVQLETRMLERMGQLETRMLKWTAGLMLGQVGLTVTLIKLLN